MAEAETVALADLNRSVFADNGPDGETSCRIGDLRSVKRWVLQGEPGSGKSTVLEQEAARAGTRPVSARAFTEGTERPDGPVVFIDAVEEYRTGDPGRDPLRDLFRALKHTNYPRWRLACRAISLSPPDRRLLQAEFGAVDIWTLDQLRSDEKLQLLASFGHPDPLTLLTKLEAIGSEGLLGNPALAKLLAGALTLDGPDIYSRGQVFERAVVEMAYETNPDLPERPERPLPSALLRAAERGCLVLMLSARSDIWLHSIRPPGDHLVTRDDLLPLEVDTEALRFAVDTPLFLGEGGSFIPAHRTVAEFLAGRALADLVNRENGAPPALPLRRAIALLSAPDGHPAPALAGTWAWFVTALSKGPHAAQAMELVGQHPELLLSQGDPAQLPTPHKRRLLESTGGKDPWFLSALRGSSAVAGLASDDIAPELTAVLVSKAESSNRRILILEALRLGRPLPQLTGPVAIVAKDALEPEWLRRRAVNVLSERSPEAAAQLRDVYEAVRQERTPEGIEVRLATVEGLVGRGATSAEVRSVLVDYATTGDRVMGYSRGLERALEAFPLEDLFEQPLPGYRRTIGGSRIYEVSGLVERILAATIARVAADLGPGTLLRWLANAGMKQDQDPGEPVRRAIAVWLTQGEDRAVALFDALSAQSHRRAWRICAEYRRWTGDHPSGVVADHILDQLECATGSKDVTFKAELAFHVVGGAAEDSRLYWRLWGLLEGRAETKLYFEALTRCSLEEWRAEWAERKRAQAEKTKRRWEKDRAWLDAHGPGVAAGVETQALGNAARVYLGEIDNIEGKSGDDRLNDWVGAENAEAILTGWSNVVANLDWPATKLADLVISRQTPWAALIAAVWLSRSTDADEASNRLSPAAALAALRGHYRLDQDARSSVAEICAACLMRGPAEREFLHQFWAGTLATKVDDDYLPHLSAFDQYDQVGLLLEGLLREEPDRPFPALRSALPILASHLPFNRVRLLVDEALARSLGPEAHALWTLVAFMADPTGHEATFAAVMSSPVVQELLDSFRNLAFVSAFQAWSEHAVSRDMALVRLLGQVFPPTEGFDTHDDRMSQAVAECVDRLAKRPTREASEAFDTLCATLAGTRWHDLLRNRREAQLRLRREVEFSAPAPVEVARALAAGRPATAVELRAVVLEVLEALARDIRDGDTSPWKGFWNHPTETGEPKSDDDETPTIKRSPKIENDCRDLLTDRMRDRLIRYGLSANRLAPEARSMDERRIDLLIIGEEVAALPLEAKRHINPELWTAPAQQLLPYTRSSKSQGYGVYLIFWFGLAAGAVSNPPGGVRIETPAALRTTIEAGLSDEQRSTIAVIVLDVSPPASDAEPRRKRARVSNTKARAPKLSRKERQQ